MALFSRSEPPESSGHSTLTPVESGFDNSRLQELALGSNLSLRRIGWRRRALLLMAVLACVGVFLVARLLAAQPEVPAEWRVTAGGHLELQSSRDPALRGLAGSLLQGVVTPNGLVPVTASQKESNRWWASSADQQSRHAQRMTVIRSLESGQVSLLLGEGPAVKVMTQPRGYAQLGTLFWVMSAFAVVVFMVGWVVPLVQPDSRNVLYALMAQAQALQLLMEAIATVSGLSLPSLLMAYEGPLRMALDLVTAAAIVHSVSIHPTPLPARQWVAVGAWGLVLAFAWAAVLGWVSAPWWWVQAIILAEGAAAIAVLTWSRRYRPHPFATVMWRFGLALEACLLLLTIVVALRPVMAPEVRPELGVAPVAWSIFFSSVVVLVPFLSRSQSVIREFAMLAGVSTLATSADLLLLALFSFSQFTSLTLSLFLALGAYAALRQWLLTQMLGARTLTTERMFESLYRIAREVEARPERAADRMSELLCHVFEPLEAVRVDALAKSSRTGGNGAVLMVPLPDLSHGPEVNGVLVLRFAERGRRLFTPEDARLADRVLEQLKRALAHDRAVERGRSEERTRIAQDLHDDIGARLLTLMYKAPSKEMEDYVRHTLQDLKTLTRGLAAKNHSLALASAEWKADIGHRLEPVRCELEWHSSFDEDITLTMVQWSSLTRIVRELVSNVISHAQATQVSIDCRLEEGRFSLVVADNGKGRQPARWAHGLGLGGIRKRVKLMGGTVVWQERQPVGILCTVDIPRLTNP